VPTQYAAHIKLVTPAGHMLAGAICNSGCLMQDKYGCKSSHLASKKASEQASKQGMNE